MAGPLPCDNHPDQVASILMTNLETGDTLTLCGPCTFEWAQMLVGVDFPEQKQEPADTTATEEQADLEPEPPAPDAEPKSEPQPATPPAAEAEQPAEAAQETTAPGD